MVMSKDEGNNNNKKKENKRTTTDQTEQQIIGSLCTHTHTTSTSKSIIASEPLGEIMRSACKLP